MSAVRKRHRPYRDSAPYGFAKGWAATNPTHIPRKESRQTNMTKIPPNQGKAWTSAEKQQLKQLAKGNTPTRVIALKLGRTPSAVQNQASNLSISLKPTNQSPYGTQKK